MADLKEIRKSKLRKIRNVFFITFAILVATTFVRYQSVIIDVPISFTAFLLAVWIYIKKGIVPGWQACKWFCASLLALELFAILVDWRLPSTGLPNTIVSFLGIISGTIISNANTSKWWKVSIPLLVYAFSAWYIAGGYNNWFNYLDGTFTGEVEEPMPQDWYTITKGNDTLRADFYKDKIILFDFWNTSCVICFRKFPDTERLYQKYKRNKNFIVQAVNIPMERDTTGMAFYMFERKNKYSFPAVMGNEAMRVKFKVEAYPTIVVVKNDTVLFRGRIELVEDFLAKNL